MVLKPKEIPKNKESPLASSALPSDLLLPFKNRTESISKSDFDKPKSLANVINNASLNEEESLTDDANLSGDANSEELSLSSVSGSKSEINSEELSLNGIASKSEINSEELSQKKSVFKSESSLNDCSFSIDLKSEAPSPQEQPDCEKVVKSPT